MEPHLLAFRFGTLVLRFVQHKGWDCDNANIMNQRSTIDVGRL
jgi:hypothetical protein